MVAPSRAEAPAAPSPRGPLATVSRAAGVPAGVWLAALMLLAAGSRVRLLTTAYWSDEALTVGIARHRLAEIPGLLRHDGSPPLYYLLLHGWMAAFGSSPVATHALSLVLGVGCVPVAWWVTGAVFGSASAWPAAALAASLPYFTIYGTQTRMYALLALTALLAVGCFLRALQTVERRWMAAAVAASVGALYTNTWALYLVASLFVVGAVWAMAERRAPPLWLVVAYGAAVGLAYLPWLPRLTYQVAHTGAPWAGFPGVRQLWFDPLRAAAGVAWPLFAAVLVGAVGICASRRVRSAQPLVLPAAGVCVATVIAGWSVAQVVRSWSPRYLGVAVVPAVLVLAGALAGRRVGRVALWVLVAGLLAAALPVLVASPGQVRSARSDLAWSVAPLAARLRPGDLVVSPQVSALPLVAYDVGAVRGLRWATPLGAVADPTVVDWSDLQAKLGAADPAAALHPLLAGVPIGGHVLLVDPASWRPSARPDNYTLVVIGAGRATDGVVMGDPNLEVVARRLGPPGVRSEYPVTVTLLVRTAGRRRPSGEGGI